MFLCLTCGQVKGKGLTCGHNNILEVIKEPQPHDDDKKDQMIKCGFCGYNASGKDPVKEVLYGTDGPNAVIATTLFQNLPPQRRKILAFADGRQEAAFFAWYLEDTYKDILSRNLILKACQNIKNYPPEGLSLSSLANRLYKDFGDAFKEKDTDDPLKIMRNIWRSLYREFLAEEKRLSLEGVGLVRWSISLPKLPSILEMFKKPPWLLVEKQVRDVLLILLNSLRVDRAVALTLDGDVSLNWKDLDFPEEYPLSFRIGLPDSKKKIRSWDGERQHGHQLINKRIASLLKILAGRGITGVEAVKIAATTLKTVWQFLDQEDQSNDKLLLHAEGDARRINPNWWRLHTVSEGDVVYQCDTCERIQGISLKNLCSNHRCSGRLQAKKLIDLKPNHYRDLYREELPHNLRVEEHTAQLDHERAREFQKDFRAGKIHVLSCSTTFELGVDLGGLDTVFLRNVPPEAFNYVQRVGRAGRRRGFPGFAITYCRKNSHDLVHFAEPQRMLSGHVNPPVLAIRNKKIIFRHITALALSKFLRDYPERYKRIGDSKSRIERLLQDMENPSGVKDFREYISRNRTKLENAIRTIVQHIEQSTIAELGIEDGSWIEEISGSRSRFAYAESVISDDYKKAQELKEEMKREDNFTKAEWAKKRADTLASDDVVSFLSRTAIIPKYGFPVDVVDLDTQQIKSSEGGDISLQRDLSIAIAEFAPSSKLIANKRVWTSYGLKKVAGKEWERWWYGRCRQHNKFIRAHSRKEIDDQECCQDMKIREYIDPQFGFVTNLDKPKKPTGRTARVFTTRPVLCWIQTKGATRRETATVTWTRDHIDSITGSYGCSL